MHFVRQTFCVLFHFDKFYGSKNTIVEALFSGQASFTELRRGINSSDSRYEPVEDFFKNCNRFQVKWKEENLDLLTGLSEWKLLYVLKWKPNIKHKFESRPKYFAYGNLRSKILHVDDKLTREIVFCYVSQAEERWPK